MFQDLIIITGRLRNEKIKYGFQNVKYTRHDKRAYLAGTGAQEYERAIRLDSRGNSLRSLSASISPFRYKESWGDGCRVVAARCLCFPRSCLALRGSKSCVSSNRLELLYNLPD